MLWGPRTESAGIWEAFGGRFVPRGRLDWPDDDPAERLGGVCSFLGVWHVALGVGSRYLAADRPGYLSVLYPLK